MSDASKTAPCPVCDGELRFGAQDLRDNFDPSGGLGSVYRAHCESCGLSVRAFLHYKYLARVLRMSLESSEEQLHQTLQARAASGKNRAEQESSAQEPARLRLFCAVCGGTLLPLFPNAGIPWELLEAQSTELSRGVEPEIQFETLWCCQGCREVWLRSEAGAGLRHLKTNAWYRHGAALPPEAWPREQG